MIITTQMTIPVTINNYSIVMALEFLKPYHATISLLDIQEISIISLPGISSEGNGLFEEDYCEDYLLQFALVGIGEQ